MLAIFLQWQPVLLWSKRDRFTSKSHTDFAAPFGSVGRLCIVTVMTLVLCMAWLVWCLFSRVVVGETATAVSCFIWFCYFSALHLLLTDLFTSAEHESYSFIIERHHRWGQTVIWRTKYIILNTKFRNVFLCESVTQPEPLCCWVDCCGGLGSSAVSSLWF